MQSIIGLRGLVTFSFLNTRYVLLSRLGNAPRTSLSSSGEDTYGASGPNNPHQPSLDIYDLSKFKPNSTQYETNFVRRYLLPNVKPTARVQLVRVFSEISTPSIIGSSSFRGAFSDLKDEGYNQECNWIGTGAPAPFTLASHSRVFVVRIVLAQERRHPFTGQWGWQGVPTQEYALLIPMASFFPDRDPNMDSSQWTLNRYVPLGAPPSLLVKTIAWRDWGPRGSRLIPLESPTDFFDVDRSFYPYGARCAFPVRIAKDLSLFRVRVININQLAVRRFVQSRAGRGITVRNGTHSSVQAVVAPTIISKSTSLFERDVMTSLPYLETCTSEGVHMDCDCFMLSEDNLFTVKVRPSRYLVRRWGALIWLSCFLQRPSNHNIPYKFTHFNFPCKFAHWQVAVREGGCVVL